MDEGKPPRSTPGFEAGVVLGGRYLLERPLGEGGMGSVWVGRQIALEREVAVKVLHAEPGAARPPSSALRREALALAAVHHPAVVQVFDYGESGEGVPYVVMELVRGESLAERLARGGPLAAEEAVALVLPLLDGLSAVHQAGIVHRDIKPENVVVTQGPRGVAPKLLDFGIARRERREAGATWGGGLVGTPPYMAPEQVTMGNTDERTDVWGAGALLYTLIAGQPPFGAGDTMEILRRVLHDPPPYPRKARGLDGRLWAILTGALRKIPGERTASAAALRDALAAWHQGRGAAPARPAPPRVTSGDDPRPPASPTPLAATLPAERGLVGGAPLVDTLDAPRGPDDGPPSIDALIRAKMARD
jgi:serine/threonine-protein kinase